MTKRDSKKLHALTRVRPCALIVNTLIVTSRAGARVFCAIRKKTMKKTIIALFFAAASAITAAQPYAYEPAVVRLTGTLMSPPGEAPSGKKITFPALQLSSPIVVTGTSEESPTEKGVMLLHMVLDEKLMATFKALKGKRAEVTGTLFHSDNGNHQTNVLIQTQAIAAK